MMRAALRLLVALILCGPAAAQSPDLAARSRAASAAMNDGRYDEAARIYREMLKALPDEPGLLTNLGMALAMAGREAEAIAPLERAIALEPTRIPAHLFLGSAHLARGDVSKAVAPLERVVAASPKDVESRRLLAQAYAAGGRTLDAVTELRRITELAPMIPAAWHALGHAYNAVTQEALATFEAESDDSPWRQLLVADAYFADGRFTDAFALYRATLEQLPSMVSIHDSIAAIYEQTGRAEWAAQERRRGMLSVTACAARPMLCEFRAGRHRAALVAALAGTDAESRYWRVRAANALALAAFDRLDTLPDSRERREMRAALARSERRHVDAIAELEAALTFAPGDPQLLDDLGTAYYLARQFEQAIETLAVPLEMRPEDGRLLTLYGDALLQLQRVDEAVPVLERAVERSPSDPTPRLALGRAHAQKGDFGAAIRLIEPELPGDHDGSLHIQLARAYTGLGQRGKAAALLERAKELQRDAQARGAAAGERTITPPD